MSFGHSCDSLDGTVVLTFFSPSLFQGLKTLKEFIFCDTRDVRLSTVSMCAYKGRV